MPFKVLPRHYALWQGMLSRCYTPTNRHFCNYGARGITVSSEWHEYAPFEAAIDALGPKPPKYSLDRIDNDRGYEPGNIRWASRTMQQRNQRVTRKVTINGKTHIAADLADISGVQTRTIVARAKRGLSIVEVLDPTQHTPRSGLALGSPIFSDIKLAQTSCKNGHEYTPENTHIDKNGWRRCRACGRIKTRRQNQQKREKAMANDAAAGLG